MTTVVVIALAAAGGALSRYGLEQALPSAADGTHYVGTLAVNWIGALTVGLVTGALGHRLAEHPTLRAAVTVGFLSSFTTFSALAIQVVGLAERGSVALAALLLGGTFVGGIGLATAGLVIGRSAISI